MRQMKEVLALIKRLRDQAPEPAVEPVLRSCHNTRVGTPT
jgi:hypothetical protein